MRYCVTEFAIPHPIPKLKGLTIEERRCQTTAYRRSLPSDLTPYSTGSPLYEEAIRRHQTYADAYLYLGLLYRDLLGNREAALEQARALCELGEGRRADFIVYGQFE